MFGVVKLGKGNVQQGVVKQRQSAVLQSNGKE